MSHDDQEIDFKTKAPAQHFVENGDARPLILSAPILRRGTAVAILGALGLILCWIALSNPPANILGTLFLVGLGGGALYLTWQIWTCTKATLLLTAEDIREDNGRILCRIEDIERVERGAFAFKPSNGFVLVLKQKTERGWAPGLWWRLGRRIGVGGVTSAGAGKAMADVVAARISGLGRLD